MQTKNYFLNQERDENILKVLHKHPVTLFREMYISVLIFIISFIVMVGYFYYNLWIIFVLAFVFFFFSVISGFYSFFVWDRDVYIITDRRIVDIEQKSLFSKVQKEAKYEKIQDTHIEINGVFGSIFRYGNLNIQTASDSSLTFHDIYDPASVQKIITELINESTEEQEEDGDSGIREEESKDEKNMALEALKSVIKEAIREEKEGQKN